MINQIVQDVNSYIAYKEAVPSTVITADGLTVGEWIDTAEFKALSFNIFSTAYQDGTYSLQFEEADSEEGDKEDARILTEEKNEIIRAQEGDIIEITSLNPDGRKVGINSNRRFIRASIVAEQVTNGATISVRLVLGAPRRSPVSQ